MSWRTFNILLLLLLLCDQFMVIRSLNGGLSPHADPYSESNAVRAGMAYAENGFSANAGLPDVGYKGIYLDQGREVDRNLQHDIYTHYPPGPDWLAGLMISVFGADDFSLLRLLPLMVAMVCAFAGIVILHHTLPPVQAGLLLTGILVTPMFRKMMHGLHYQGYAFSLLFLQLVVMMHWVFAGKAIGKRAGLILFCMGFVQGWLSFDYFFLVSLLAAPFFLLRPVGKRCALLLLGAPAAGFLLAHLLHFGQIVLYYGDGHAAFADLAGSASKRAGVSVATSRTSVAWEYITYAASRARFFGLDLSWPFAGMLTWAVGSHFSLQRRWTLSWSEFFAWFSSLGVSLLWIVTMKNHAQEHMHFLPRHLFFPWFMVLFIVVRKFGAVDRKITSTHP